MFESDARPRGFNSQFCFDVVQNVVESINPFFLPFDDCADSKHNEKLQEANTCEHLNMKASTAPH